MKEVKHSFLRDLKNIILENMVEDENNTEREGDRYKKF